MAKKAAFWKQMKTKTKKLTNAINKKNGVGLKKPNHLASNTKEYVVDGYSSYRSKLERAREYINPVTADLSDVDPVDLSDNFGKSNIGPPEQGQSSQTDVNPFSRPRLGEDATF